MKLFTLKSHRGTITIIHPDSIIRIIEQKNDCFQGSEVELRQAMCVSAYDTRSPEVLAEQINRECYNITTL